MKHIHNSGHFNFMHLKLNKFRKFYSLNWPKIKRILSNHVLFKIIKSPNVPTHYIYTLACSMKIYSEISYDGIDWKLKGCRADMRTHLTEKFTFINVIAGMRSLDLFGLFECCLYVYMCLLVCMCVCVLWAYYWRRYDKKQMN